jgi:hypothetical protein
MYIINNLQVKKDEKRKNWRKKRNSGRKRDFTRGSSAGSVYLVIV